VPYHHGDLRAALLAAAEARVRAAGPASVRLRGLARQLGVSHAAPAHHFGTRRGLLTALAAQGHELMDQAMARADRSGGFAEVGVAYVRFAVEHPAHFAVMFAPDLLDLDDPALRAARAATLARLTTGTAAVASRGGAVDAGAAAVAVWSMMHGLATLHLSGSLDDDAVRAVVSDREHGDGVADVLSLARRAARVLFPGRVPTGPAASVASPAGTG